MPPAAPLLAIRDLCVNFGPSRVVDHVSFSVDQGEKFALVGESGSGKTTVARMVVGLLPPSSGEVIIDGVSMTSARQAQARQRLRRQRRRARPRSACAPARLLL